MILVGNQRGGGKDLATHLMKEENERVTVHEVRGFVASDLHGAFQESYAISRATHCKQHLYSLSLNPPKDEQVSVAEFEEAISRAECRLGLTGQPRAIVFHEKIGADGELRRHAHAVWCRIDTDEMNAIHMSHDHRKLNDVSRELYLKHDWTMPKGLVKSEWKDPATYSLAEWQQAKRAKRDPKDTKIMFQDAWAVSDSKAAFQAALKERGLILARGDRRGYVALDHEGEVYAISKWTGQKTKAVKARLADPESLPSVKEAHQQAAKIVTNRLSNVILYPKGALTTYEAKFVQSKEVAPLFRHADANVMAQVEPSLGQSNRARLFGPAQTLVFMPAPAWRTEEVHVAVAEATTPPRGQLRLTPEEAASIAKRYRQGVAHLIAEGYEPGDRDRVRAAVMRAAAYEIDLMEDLEIFVNLDLTYGPRFEQEPQYRGALAQLRDLHRAPDTRLDYAVEICSTVRRAS